MLANPRCVLLMVALGVLSSRPSPTVAVEYSWPNGYYTLPKAIKQTCATNFETGERIQTTERDLIGGNEWSSPLDLDGQQSKGQMEWRFCSKTQTSDDKEGNTWKDKYGTYCIMKKGTSCPLNSDGTKIFDEGSIQWDDEDIRNNNYWNGELPEGVYDEDTKIEFCCREDGSSVVPLKLPTDQPFILFMKTQATCQNVEGMIDTQEWFHWDGEDELLGFERYFEGSVPFHDGRDNNHKVHFCYYESM